MLFPWFSWFCCFSSLLRQTLVAHFSHFIVSCHLHLFHSVQLQFLLQFSSPSMNILYYELNMSYNVFRSLIYLTSILFNIYILHIFWVYYFITLCIVNGTCICIYIHVCLHNQLYLTIFDCMDCSPPLSMGFSWREYWSGLPFPPPGDLPNPVIKPTFPVSPALQADSLPLCHLESQKYAYFGSCMLCIISIYSCIYIYIYIYICIDKIFACWVCILLSCWTHNCEGIPELTFMTEFLEVFC